MACEDKFIGNSQLIEFLKYFLIVVAIQVDQRVIAHNQKSNIRMLAYNFSSCIGESEVVFYRGDSRDRAYQGAVRRNLQFSSDQFFVYNHVVGWNFDRIVNNSSAAFRQRQCEYLLRLLRYKDEVLNGEE